MALKLDILKDAKNTDSFRSYSYADIHLDLELNSHTSNKTVGANKNAQDLKLSYDENAIYNSIRNIFNTKKGQKILTPTFGLDLEQYLFENISKAAWQQWLERLVRIINENQLSTADSGNLDIIEAHMKGFLFGEGDLGGQPAGFAPRKK